MTAPRKTAKPAATQADSTAKSKVKTGAAQAKSVAKRPANGPKRGRGGAEPTAGELLRAELALDGDPVGIRMLVRQAARIADRLEALDLLLSGHADAWAVLSLPRSDAKRGRIVVEVQVAEPLKEERALAVLFRSVLADIHKQRAGLKGGGEDDEDDDLVD